MVYNYGKRLKVVIAIYDLAVISILLVIVQISDSYLRYLAFSRKAIKSEIRQLWLKISIYSIFCFFAYFAIFSHFGVIPIAYKLVLMIGWIPFFAISVKYVKISLLQHFFIFGMAAIWNLMNHSVTSIIDVIFFESESQISIYTYHALIYLTIFVILLPIERKCFVNLLPRENFFDEQPYGKYIVLFPFVITFGILILWTDNHLFHSWQERISRMYLPFAFFLFYRYVLSANKEIYEKQKTVRYNQRLKEQLSTLKEYNELIQRNQQQITILRHDMRHDYRLIYAMLQDGNIEKVLEHIKIKENVLNLTIVQNFCYAPIVNAAILIYLQRAKDFDIKVEHKINLPEKLNIDENDFAIFISNLLENAINASLKQSREKRKISITIEHIENQCALEITNLFDGEVIFENGLPKTSEDGHGIGMLSLKNFVEKYNAQMDFSQENGEVRVIIYWEDV